MPRTLKDSDEETDMKAGRKTRVANTDSPFRRSTRSKLAFKQNDSSPDSCVSDASNPGNAQNVRVTRQRTTAMDASALNEIHKSVRSRTNSISLDVTETAEINIGTPTKRTRKSSILLDAVKTNNRKSNRLTRASSEANSPPMATRVTRTTRATSLGPDAGIGDSTANKYDSDLNNTSSKSRIQTYILPTEETLFELKDEDMKIAMVQLECTLPNVIKNSAMESNKSINEEESLPDTSNVNVNSMAVNVGRNSPAKDVSSIRFGVIEKDGTTNNEILNTEKGILEHSESMALNIENQTESSINIESKMEPQSDSEDRELSLKFEDVENAQIDTKGDNENGTDIAVNVVSDTGHIEQTSYKLFLESPKNVHSNNMDTSELISKICMSSNTEIKTSTNQSHLEIAGEPSKDEASLTVATNSNDVSNNLESERMDISISVSNINTTDSAFSTVIENNETTVTKSNQYCTVLETRDSVDIAHMAREQSKKCSTLERQPIEMQDASKTEENKNNSLPKKRKISKQNVKPIDSGDSDSDLNLANFFQDITAQQWNEKNTETNKDAVPFVSAESLKSQTKDGGEHVLFNKRSIDMNEYQSPPQNNNRLSTSKRNSLSQTSFSNSNMNASRKSKDGKMFLNKSTLFDGCSNSSSERNDGSCKNADSDIERKYNLYGKNIFKFSDDDVPGDECRASETESSYPDDHGSDIADFIVHDTEVEEKEESDTEQNPKNLKNLQVENIKTEEVQVDKITEKESVVKNIKNTNDIQESLTKILKIADNILEKQSLKNKNKKAKVYNVPAKQEVNNSNVNKPIVKDVCGYVANLVNRDIKAALQNSVQENIVKKKRKQAKVEDGTDKIVYKNNKMKKSQEGNGDLTTETKRRKILATEDASTSLQLMFCSEPRRAYTTNMQITSGYTKLSPRGSTTDFIVTDLQQMEKGKKKKAKAYNVPKKQEVYNNNVNKPIGEDVYGYVANFVNRDTKAALQNSVLENIVKKKRKQAKVEDGTDKIVDKKNKLKKSREDNVNLTTETKRRKILTTEDACTSLESMFCSEPRVTCTTDMQITSGYTKLSLRGSTTDFIVTDLQQMKKEKKKKAIVYNVPAKQEVNNSNVNKPIGKDVYGYVASLVNRDTKAAFRNSVQQNIVKKRRNQAKVEVGRDKIVYKKNNMKKSQEDNVDLSTKTKRRKIFTTEDACTSLESMFCSEPRVTCTTDMQITSGYTELSPRGSRTDFIAADLQQIKKKKKNKKKLLPFLFKRAMFRKMPRYPATT